MPMGVGALVITGRSRPGTWDGWPDPRYCLKAGGDADWQSEVHPVFTSVAV
jgi:hypothetical protein